MTNEYFDEGVFIWSLSARPEDARDMMSIFRPQWLHDPAHQAILAGLYRFVRNYKMVPDLDTLGKALRAEDETIYSHRLEPALDLIKQTNPPIAEQVFVVEQAKRAAITRSFQEMISQSDFQTKILSNDGRSVMRDVTRWMRQFEDSNVEVTARIDELTEMLIRENHKNAHAFKMPTNIGPIDDWTNEGLRSKQLGIIIAPTGHGKSVILMSMAFNMAIQDEVNIWFITNELSAEEQTERFLSRITGEPVSEIQDDPHIAHHHLKKKWDINANNRLLLTSVNKEMSMNEVESMMARHNNLYGWKPNVICLDYMERMKPNETGYDRNREWNWLGAIAGDMVRFAKRHNIILWTAAQTNRAGMSDAEMRMDMAQGSIKHLQEAAAVIGSRKVYVEGEEGSGEESIGMEFFPLKMRHGKTTRSKILKVNLATMRITQEEGKRIDRTGDEEEDEEELGSGKHLPTSMKGRLSGKGKKGK